MRWISIDEQLPHFAKGGADEPSLVFTNGRFVYAGTAEQTTNGGHVFITDDRTWIYDATHWMYASDMMGVICWEDRS